MAGIYFSTVAMYLLFPVALLVCDGIRLRWQRKRRERETLEFWAEAYKQAAREYAKRIR